MNHPVFEERRAFSNQRLQEFGDAFGRRLALPEALGSDTCVYVTGSAGRGELSAFSDLDLFLIRDSSRPSRLDEMVIGGTVITALHDCRFPKPSKDGEFLTLHKLADMIKYFGMREDDARNLFTARMLLLLESRCVHGQATYDKAINEVLEGYWRNLDKHPSDYLPIILLNDISRYWRIVLLNYEAKQNPSPTPSDAIGEAEAKAKKRLGSHKLRFSRCLLCYSAIAFLLAEAREGGWHVDRGRVRYMVSLAPAERMSRVAELDASCAPLIGALLEQYAAFLERVNYPEGELLRRFQDSAFRSDCYAKGEAFGKSMFDLIETLGRDNPLYRYLVV